MTNRMSGIYAGPRASCDEDNEEYKSVFSYLHPRDIIFDTQSIVRGTFDEVAANNSRAASQNHVAEGADKLIRIEDGDIVIPFFLNGLADDSDTKVRSTRDTNVWGGKYGSLHNADHPYGVRRTSERGLNRSKIWMTHLAVDFFNQDGTAALDLDLIDLQHAYLLLRGEIDGLDHASSPLELGSVAQYHGLWRSGMGAGDADAQLTGQGAASNAWQEGRAPIKLQRAILLELADLSDDNRPTRTWIEMRIPLANKTAGPGGIYVADGLTLLADGLGGEDPAAFQPALSIRVQAIADRSQNGPEFQG